MLIERLMGLNDDGSISDGGSLKIPLQQFRAAFAEVVRGNTTRDEVIADFALRSEDMADLLAIIALAPPANDVPGRILYLNRVFDILALAERKRLGLDTSAAVRAKLGI